MNSPFPSNSRATYEPLMSDLRYITPSTVEMQSSSITLSTSLWQQRLSRVAYENPSPVSSQKNLNKDEASQSAAPSLKNQAAIELLRSWREDDEYDEEEQKATWEFLKQALDEDRLSDRKFFP